MISPAGPVRNLDGAVIKDSSGDIGFPGYDGMTGPNALAYTLDMQTHGVSVTDTYLSDLHDSWTTGDPFGPGQAGYEKQLRKRERRVRHFVGSAPTPAGCNGVTVTCHYSKIDEVNGNLTGMLGAVGVHTPFDVEADSAPALYVHGQPARTAAPVRTLAQQLARLKELDLVSGKKVRLTNYLADPVELKLLHMVTADPKRTPSLVLFASDNFWLSSGPASCGKSCVSEPAGTDARNHGDVASRINTTWLGMVGPGVAHLGVDSSAWSDHTNIQPTMMELLGLHDDYVPDGRVLVELLDPADLPPALRVNRPALLRLGQVYTQLEAAVGRFGLDTLRASTRALASTSPGGARYATIEHQLEQLGVARDGVASQIRALLDGAAFGNQPVNGSQAQALIHQGEGVLAAAAHLAA